MRPLPYRYEVFSPDCVCYAALRARRRFRESSWVELPESAWTNKHSRDLSTRPHPGKPDSGSLKMTGRRRSPTKVTLPAALLSCVNLRIMLFHPAVGFGQRAKAEAVIDPVRILCDHRPSA